MLDLTTRWQFMRYAVVGLGSNLVLYIAYLYLTALGFDHKISMSVIYVIGVAQTFYFNRSWSFKHQGKLHGALLRYITSYAAGYLLNLSVLWLAVDYFNFPHQIVQGAMIFVLAALLFLLQKYWVFLEHDNHADTV